MARKFRLQLIAGWTGTLIRVAAAATLAVAWFTSGNTCNRHGVLVRPMQVIVYGGYGPPDGIHLARMETPLPQNDQLLIKVPAASANPLQGDHHAD